MGKLLDDDAGLCEATLGIPYDQQDKSVHAIVCSGGGCDDSR